MNAEQAKIEFTSGNSGYYAVDCGVLTFEVEGVEFKEEWQNDEYRNLYSKYLNEYQTMTIEGYSVPMWGENHNLYPQEVRNVISNNKLLPSVLQKRIDFLFGKGPYLYKIENIENKTERIPVYDKAILDWLESWEQYGYENYWTYLYNLINDFYHLKTCISQYHFNRSRRLGNEKSILGLSYIGSDEARLAAKGQFINRRIKQSDCTHVIVGDWFMSVGNEFKVFPRFKPNDPLANAEAVAFNTEKSFGAWVYAYNDWFKGLFEWIKGSNLTPRYLNSYLKNALNSHVHIKIPLFWVTAEKNTLQSLCQQNVVSVNQQNIVKSYLGVDLTDSTGKPYRFNEAMLQDRIKYELKKISELMSGEGKNQGKAYASISMGQEGWGFEEMPQKFKEYFDSVISYDKRADQVVIAGIGISSSITNVENDGVLSKSGSDVYYNYIIYQHTLTKPEEFICREINRAIQMNFPHAKEQGIRLGFNIEIPAKTEDVSEKNRLLQQQPL
ncbi:MAG: hypothetical protein LBB53_06785 [Prevotellaceae bacterium]|nr:hypothetical protein [Prevotellaceae bacterium]